MVDYEQLIKVAAMTGRCWKIWTWSGLAYRERS